jgi:hypothetical protein
VRRGLGASATFSGLFGMALGVWMLGSTAAAATLPAPPVPPPSLPTVAPLDTPPVPPRPPVPVQLPPAASPPTQLPPAASPPPQVPPAASPPAQVPPAASPDPVSEPLMFAATGSSSVAVAPGAGFAQDPGPPAALPASQQTATEPAATSEQIAAASASAAAAPVRTALPRATSDKPGGRCLAATSTGLAADRVCGATLVKPSVLTGSVGSRDVARTDVDGGLLATTGFGALSLAVVGVALIATGAMLLALQRRRNDSHGTLGAHSAG